MGQRKIGISGKNKISEKVGTKYSPHCHVSHFTKFVVFSYKRFLNITSPLPLSWQEGMDEKRKLLRMCLIIFFQQYNLSNMMK